FKRIMTCVIDHDDCDGFVACATEGLPDPTAPASLRSCRDSAPDAALRAVGIPREEWGHRPGAGVTRLRDAVSSPGEPIEICGQGAAASWLATLRCDDGSQPIKDAADIQRARTGNVGRGGRCMAYIDHYAVACPESSYELYVDAYLCPR